MICGYGGIGRRATLRALWEIIVPYQFDSGYPHFGEAMREEVEFTFVAIDESDNIVDYGKTLQELQSAIQGKFADEEIDDEDEVAIYRRVGILKAKKKKVEVTFKETK